MKREREREREGEGERERRASGGVRLIQKRGNTLTLSHP